MITQDDGAPVIASSLVKDNLWFIFRQDGKEVAFEINDGAPRSYLYKLTTRELECIKTNLI